MKEILAEFQDVMADVPNQPTELLVLVSDLTGKLKGQIDREIESRN